MQEIPMTDYASLSLEMTLLSWTPGGGGQEGVGGGGGGEDEEESSSL